jgi:uncharacterized protein (TIRG00374 family)
VVSEQAAPPPAAEPSLGWKTIAKRVALVAVSGVALYFVLPSVIEVLGSWPRLSSLDLIWFAAAIALEIAHFGCTFALQRMALRTKGWFAVITAQLSGNAITDLLPAGAAAGAAVQFKMLSTAGIDSDTAVGGLTAFSLLGVGGLLALPIFTLPAIVLGAPVSGDVTHIVLIGIGGFVLFAAFGALVLATDGPLRWAGRAIQRVVNAVRRRRPRIEGLDRRLLGQRDLIRGILGRQWAGAVLLSAGRLLFDYGCLDACVRATGAHPRPSLVLLAYAVAGLIALVPVTPGGLGVVEAGMTGMLVLVGMDASTAFLATLAYRLCSYWIPMLCGPGAYLWFRLRYRGETATAAAS